MKGGEGKQGKGSRRRGAGEQEKGSSRRGAGEGSRRRKGKMDERGDDGGDGGDGGGHSFSTHDAI